MTFKNSLLTIGFVLLVIAIVVQWHQPTSSLPLVAIANYGPHASLEASIQGIKEALAKQGYVDHKTIRYHIVEVGFDPALIPQMINQLTSEQPKVMVVQTTPVAQFAKGTVKHIPLVYSVVTDPVEAGLLTNAHEASAQMTGSSDQQNLQVFLQFVKTLLPHAHRVGVLFATAEANDRALVQMMQAAAKATGMTVLAIPVDQARDVPMAVQRFRNQVDLIYVGSSGAVQPTLPVIAAEAKSMHIPVFNMDESAVKEGLALACFGVDYQGVGRGAGNLVAALLKGASPSALKPIYPSVADYHALINRRQAQALGIQIPPHVSSHVQLVE